MQCNLVMFIPSREIIYSLAAYFASDACTVEIANRIQITKFKRNERIQFYLIFLFNVFPGRNGTCQIKNCEQKVAYVLIYLVLHSTLLYSINQINLLKMRTILLLPTCFHIFNILLCTHL